MSFHYRKEVISPEVLQELYSLTPEQKAQKEIRDAQIRAIITGESDKFLLIIGPCSADHEDSVCEYITRLAKMQEKVEEKILIVPRIYTNKPRTTGEGYKGIVHQPDPEKAPDFMEGLIAMRKMHLRAISETGLFSADEMLYPENWPYISDILSYVAVGARQCIQLVCGGIDCTIQYVICCHCGRIHQALLCCGEVRCIRSHILQRHSKVTCSVVVLIYI